MDENYTCEFEFSEVSYLHSILLSYVRNVKKFRTKVSSLDQIKLKERSTPEMGIHYKCFDKFRGDEYIIPNDKYVFDFIKEFKNDREFNTTISAFLERLSDASKKIEQFYEDFEMYE